jgi:hypothetical protein
MNIEIIFFHYFFGDEIIRAFDFLPPPARAARSAKASVRVDRHLSPLIERRRQSYHFGQVAGCRSSSRVARLVWSA